MTHLRIRGDRRVALRKRIAAAKPTATVAVSSNGASAASSGGTLASNIRTAAIGGRRPGRAATVRESARTLALALRRGRDAAHLLPMAAARILPQQTGQPFETAVPRDLLQVMAAQDQTPASPSTLLSTVSAATTFSRPSATLLVRHAACHPPLPIEDCMAYMLSLRQS